MQDLLFRLGLYHARREMSISDAAERRPEDGGRIDKLAAIWYI